MVALALAGERTRRERGTGSSDVVAHIIYSIYALGAGSLLRLKSGQLSCPYSLAERIDALWMV